MKGGKGGRKRRPSGAGGAAAAADRRKPKKGSDGRLADAPPKKGSRKKTFGPTSTREDS
jgi:hypothetical protein